MRVALDRHHKLLTEAVETRGGQDITGTGDGMHAVRASSDEAVVAASDGAAGVLTWSSFSSGRRRDQLFVETKRDRSSWGDDQERDEHESVRRVPVRSRSLMDLGAARVAPVINGHHAERLDWRRAHDSACASQKPAANVWLAAWLTPVASR
jgi:hypothetical protein